ncbi:Oidioi.mRNA.OKI2018_I69.chr2.g6680.t1.cds [Oikopleura dioica]|uniref:Oidioi.mRNA.OKI2018_I69.chr2.g6680.t1.cds n=1 Tax=Oikopleura dioica TaxID=34765 RepID=A0ABN7TD13_OIKDI|nr:Oidioi.mRNA.OKI2018_I69.chr2.g6680.t1.cds [Oikopleura dioica]
MTGERVVFISAFEGREDILFVKNDKKNIHTTTIFRQPTCACNRHTEKIIERKYPGSDQSNCYYTCEICFHGQIDATAVKKENTTMFKCPAGVCDGSQNFKSFIEGICCESAQRKVEYDRRVDIGTFQRDFEKAVDTENNIIQDIKDAKEAKKRTKEEADRAIEADKAAEERIRSLEESLPKIQQEVDAKRKKLDGVIASTFRVINTCKTEQLKIEMKKKELFRFEKNRNYPH